MFSGLGRNNSSAASMPFGLATLATVSSDPRWMTSVPAVSSDAGQQQQVMLQPTRASGNQVEGGQAALTQEPSQGKSHQPASRRHQSNSTGGSRPP